MRALYLFEEMHMPTHRELANAIRFLSIDAVQKAKSGHPGMPMGMADIAEVLWNDFLHFNPRNPKWTNRDRFVLSNGHGSMLLYSLLHLTGYALSIDDLKQFRQLHSKTPGHPEIFDTPGVETTTGPLGQGIANAVGMAIAEKILAAKFNREPFNIVDHYTYVFMGDGCLMEGISHEVCSLAGTLGLGKLIAFWDDNGISIDGPVAGWFKDDTPKRFEAYGWHVIFDVDGHDAAAVTQAIESARAVTDKPTLICCKTTIGFGSPLKAGSESCHGSPLGEEEIQKVRETLHWTYAPFEIPEEMYEVYDARERGGALEKVWKEHFDEYQKNYPDLAEEFLRQINHKLPETWKTEFQTLIDNFAQQSEAIATRKASQKVIEAITPLLPELLGGSADLTGSNLTNCSRSVSLSFDQSNANYIHYGVREFGMSAIMNGLAIHGGFIPYGGTFLIFESYAANAVRMSALMKQRVIYVYTHDSIGLGEDGPTHQPIEQLPSLRAIPNLSVWRPCDLIETAVAWRNAIEKQDGPSALSLSRQKLPAYQRDAVMIENINRGGYVLKDCHSREDNSRHSRESGNPEIILIATGSEISLAMTAAEQMKNRRVRVVSMPSIDAFMEQDKVYRDTVLPPDVPARIAIEAASTMGWHAIVGDHGRIIGIDHFGASAPAKDLFQEFGFTAEHVIQVANELLGK